MIVFSVEIKKCLVCQLRNHFRVSAGLMEIWRIRVQYPHDLTIQHIFRRRQCTLHFIIDHSIVDQRTVRIFQLIVPAFLTEDLLFLINVRMKHCIQIHMHQVLKIPFIAACYRIHCLVRVSHGIQERIQGTLHQFHKRILHREICGTAEYGMFHNMRYTRTV